MNQPDFGYLYGMYLGDGCVYGVDKNYSTTFQLRGIDLDVVEHTTRLLNHYFGTNITAQKLNERLFGTNTCKASVVDFFLSTCGKSPKEFPPWFHMQPRPFRVELLAGLLDTDGYTSFKTLTNRFLSDGRPKTQISVGFCSTSPWISDVKKLAEDLGIRVGKIYLKSNGQTNGHKGKLQVYGINLRVSDFVKHQCFFRCQRKQSRLVRYSETYGLSYPHRPYARHHLLTQV